MEEHVEKEEQKLEGREVRIARGIELFLKNQILYIRMLFLAIIGFLLKTTYLRLEQGGESGWLHLGRGIVTLTIFALFIITFAIEHLDARERNAQGLVDSQAEQKSQIFRYFLDQVIPNVKNNEEKMKLGHSLSDMLAIVNIQDVKKDMGILVSAQSSFLSSMVDEMTQLKNEMKEILLDKLPSRGEKVTAKELEKQIEDQLSSA